MFDKNLMLFTNLAATVAPQTSPAVDLGLGGTPVDHPLVVRTFWGAAAAAGTLTLTVEVAPDGVAGPWTQVATTTIPVDPSVEVNRELAVRFYTRQRWVRATVGGVAATGLMSGVTMAARSSPEQEA